MCFFLPYQHVINIGYNKGIFVLDEASLYWGLTLLDYIWVGHPVHNWKIDACV